MFSSPPGEYEIVEVVVAPGQEALLHDVRLDAHPVALTLDVRLHAVQQVFNGRDGLPGSKRHHRLLVRLQAVDGVVIETQILLRPQHADHDGGAAGGDGLSSGDANQHLEEMFRSFTCFYQQNVLYICVSKMLLSLMFMCHFAAVDVSGVSF